MQTSYRENITKETIFNMMNEVSFHYLSSGHPNDSDYSVSTAIAMVRGFFSSLSYSDQVKNFLDTIQSPLLSHNEILYLFNLLLVKLTQLPSPFLNDRSSDIFNPTAIYRKEWAFFYNLIVTVYFYDTQLSPHLNDSIFWSLEKLVKHPSIVFNRKENFDFIYYDGGTIVNCIEFLELCEINNIDQPLATELILRDFSLSKPVIRLGRRLSYDGQCSIDEISSMIDFSAMLRKKNEDAAMPIPDYFLYALFTAIPRYFAYFKSLEKRPENSEEKSGVHEQKQGHEVIAPYSLTRKNLIDAFSLNSIRVDDIQSVFSSFELFKEANCIQYIDDALFLIEKTSLLRSVVQELRTATSFLGSGILSRNLLVEIFNVFRTENLDHEQIKSRIREIVNHHEEFRRKQQAALAYTPPVNRQTVHHSTIELCVKKMIQHLISVYHSRLSALGREGLMEEILACNTLRLDEFKYEPGFFKLKPGITKKDLIEERLRTVTGEPIPFAEPPLTMIQFVSLVWMAVNDGEKITVGSIEESQHSFFDALYNIQTTYDQEKNGGSGSACMNGFVVQLIDCLDKRYANCYIVRYDLVITDQLLSVALTNFQKKIIEKDFVDLFQQWGFKSGVGVDPEPFKRLAVESVDEAKKYLLPALCDELAKTTLLTEQEKNDIQLNVEKKINEQKFFFFEDDYILYRACENLRSASPSEIGLFQEGKEETGTEEIKTEEKHHCP